MLTYQFVLCRESGANFPETKIAYETGGYGFEFLKKKIFFLIFFNFLIF